MCGGVAFGVCVYGAWHGGAESGAQMAKESGVSRNAFIEVTPPPGRGVRWISEDDFILIGSSDLFPSRLAP